MAQAAWDSGVFETSSEAETLQLARRFGQTLRRPCFVMLSGDLGTGKTTFVRGLVDGLDVPESVTVRSPSFTLVNQYSGRLPIYHIDLYRLETAHDLESIGMDEIASQEAVVVVEWADKLQLPPVSGWWVEISDRGEDKRELRFRILPAET
ncbi:MAG TPA: tRNA (adenosine(37)-N6)-threonylcarbamoyltransferase complex ATPase subunit type 1 TsaE [Acidobacteriota bacterium]|jgi:tRNA threonylcarbamoyladenosine biosynthesis protein TsaE